MAKGKRRATGPQSSAPVSPQTLAPARRASRAKERERRRKQRRQRTTVAAIAGVAVVVALLAFVIGRAVTRDDAPTGPKQRTQRTLLLSITNAEGRAVATSLYAYDPVSRRASLVLIPPNTLTDVAGLGNVVLGNAVRLGGADSARESVADLMGIVVDHDWTLTADGFRKLVDGVGGIVVDVDVEIVVDRQIIVTAGPGQRLDGARALRYATYTERGQDQITFQARLQRVLEALFAALPASPIEMSTSLLALGNDGPTSWKPEPLADFIHGVRTAHSEDRYEPQVLPVTPIDAGGGAPAFGIKADEVKTLVANQLADSIPPGRDDGTNRVLILNGVGTPGIGEGVARKLRNEFRIVGTRNKQGFGEKVSVVVVFDATDASLTKARRVAELLGLSSAAIRTSAVTQSVADVVVVIGADYKP